MKPGIHVRWSVRENDWLISWELPATKSTGHLVSRVLTSEGGLLHEDIVADLERRGFDTKRIRVTIPFRREQL